MFYKEVKKVKELGKTRIKKFFLVVEPLRSGYRKPPPPRPYKWFKTCFRQFFPLLKKKNVFFAYFLGVSPRQVISGSKLFFRQCFPFMKKKMFFA